MKTTIWKQMHNNESGTRPGVIIRRLILVLIGLILGFNMYFVNARALGGNELPMPFGKGAAVVLSGSMEPTLKVNDLIIVAKAETFNDNDIIVYQSGRDLIVHRIISVDGSQIITKGDANTVADPPIEQNAVKGIVVFRIPAAGLLVKAIRTPTGIIVILAFAFLLVELSFRKEKEEDNKKLDEIKQEIRRLQAMQDSQSKKDK